MCVCMCEWEGSVGQWWIEIKSVSPRVRMNMYNVCLSVCLSVCIFRGAHPEVGQNDSREEVLPVGKEKAFSANS